MKDFDALPQDMREALIKAIDKGKDVSLRITNYVGETRSYDEITITFGKK